MALHPKETIEQVQKFLSGLKRRQQITLGAGVCLVVLSLFVFVILLNRADYKPLYSGLQPEEAQSIARTLAADNIPYQISTDGTSLSVPAGKLDSVRLDLASQGLPQTGRLGLELFDKPNWAGSEFAERVNYQRALEGELERTIRAIRQVQSARVHLVLPHDSLFTEQERQAKASVVIKRREGRLAKSAVESITYLVASAVDNLRPENVTVIDADSSVPLLSRRHQTPVNWAEIEDLENSLSEKLVSTLTPVVGPEGLRANVTVECDLGSSDSTQETYDPNGSVVTLSQTSEDHTRDSEAQGIPGTPSNVPGASARGAATAALGSSPDLIGQRTEHKTYAVSRAVRHVIQPAGGIKRLAAAVVVDYAVESSYEAGRRVEGRRKRSPEEMKEIEDLAKAAIGFDPTRGDHLSVQNISFVAIPSEGPPANLTERVAPVLQEWMGVIRYAGLAMLFLAIYWMVLRPVKRQIVAAWAVEQPQLASKGLKQGALGEGEKLAPALDAKGGEGEGMDEDLRGELSDINKERKRTVALRGQLVEKIKGNPEAASRLIQSWIRQGEAKA
jgi:flagellar M-ring protein FliF